MRKILLFTVLSCLAAVSFAAGDVRVLSNYSLQETSQRFEMALQEAHVPVLDERKLDRTQGMEIRFSSPVYGSNIGVCNKGKRKDAPMSTRIWKDGNGNVWLSYQQPQPHINQFGVIECGHEADNVSRALSGFASMATGN